LAVGDVDGMYETIQDNRGVTRPHGMSLDSGRDLSLEMKLRYTKDMVNSIGNDQFVGFRSFRCPESPGTRITMTKSNGAGQEAFQPKQCET
jgi:hypothetical protein